MRSLRFTLRFAVGSILFVALFATASMAQNNRTFVSGAGLDSNPCSLTSPCRTFGQAISVTNAGGEVVVLTSAGYGPFAINKAVTVEATAGVYAGITVTGSSDGIDINAGSTDIVILRGLTVNSEGSTGNGIVFNSGATLHIESCVVNGFADNSGIAINSFGNVVVKSTIARGNGNGILVDPTGTGTTATADVAMDHLHLDGNSAGLVVSPTGSGATVTAAIKNSSASGSTGTGMVAVGSGAALDIEGCLIANDSVGVSALTGGTMSISNCTISYCLTGYNNSGGTINTRGQNTNTSPANTGRLTALAGQ
jgi:hypothetical protein